MLTYKEFYSWLEGYLFGKLENRHIDIAPIVEKMGEVKDEPRIGIAEPYTIPMPINPYTKKDNPYQPPYEIYCGNKKRKK